MEFGPSVFNKRKWSLECRKTIEKEEWVEAEWIISKSVECSGV